MFSIKSPPFSPIIPVLFILGASIVILLKSTFLIFPFSCPIIPVILPSFAFVILTFSKSISPIFVDISFIKPDFSSLSTISMFSSFFFPLLPSNLAIVTLVFMSFFPLKFISFINL